MKRYMNDLVRNFNQNQNLTPFDKKKTDIFLDDISELLMYDYHHEYDEKEFMSKYEKTVQEFKTTLHDRMDINELTDEFFSSLAEIRRTLNTSIEAILDGDPASKSKQQIVLMYPGFEAILYYRIAHQFHKMNFLLIARYISEKAHHHTGIDINPGATIGDYFFIDHGTGIVIGETAIIGNNVKLYQGVTLGALSLSKGRRLTGQKRHPTVEDNVTIYSNAAIFGGDTILHEGCTIGGDVYLTHSVEAHCIVLQTDENLKIIKR